MSVPVVRREPAGIINHRGENAFLCASLQLLLHIPLLGEWLQGGTFAEGSVSHAMSSLSKMHRTQQIVDPEPLLSLLPFAGDERTCHKVCDFVLSALVSECVNYSPFPERLLGGVISVTEKCEVCSQTDEVMHRALIFPVLVSGGITSIRQGLWQYEQDRVSLSSCCDKPKISSEVVLVSPAVLMLKVEGAARDTPPAIDNEVCFASRQYRLLSAVLCDGNRYVIICRAAERWFKVEDCSIRPYNVMNLFCNVEKVKDLHMVIYEACDRPISLDDYDAPDSEMPPECDTCDVDDAPVLPEPVGRVARRNRKDQGKIWKPTLPEDLTYQRATASYIQLDLFDPLLTEDDVPGAILPGPDVEEYSVEVLKRWLHCRGAKVSGNKEQLVERIKARLENGSSNILVPEIDKYKWYTMKREALLAQNTRLRPALLPLTGWGKFPSEDIPNNFNWGHAHVYLLENSPEWSSAMDYQECESEEETFSQEVMETVGQIDIARKGERFLHSEHILELMDVRTVLFCEG